MSQRQHLVACCLSSSVGDVCGHSLAMATERVFEATVIVCRRQTKWLHEKFRILGLHEELLLFVWVT
jgi:hypothetical protein